MYVMGYVDNEEGIAKGKAEGLLEGIAQTQIQNVMRMKENNLSDSDISKFLGIEQSEVRKIISES